MLNKEKLIEWAWLNLQFDNCPESWEDTYIIDIINNYDGICITNDGKALTYPQIRNNFYEYEEEEEEV